MSHAADVQLETQIREMLRELIDDVLGPDVSQTLPLDDDRLLAYELGLASIEIVALLDQLHARFGIRLEELWLDAKSHADVFDRLSVGWVLAAAKRARVPGTSALAE